MTAALAVHPLRAPADVDAAADLALLILRAGPRELVEDENLPMREPAAEHATAARYFADLLAAQDRDVMRARILRAVDAGVRHAVGWPGTLAPCVAAVRAALAVTAATGEAGACMSASEVDGLMLDAYDQAIARDAP